MDVIIRNEMVERVRPGDKAVFTGSLIVIPDMGAFQAPGERTLLQSHLPQTTAASGRGVSGISSTGSRELHYKLAFLANNIQVCPHISNMDAVTAVLFVQHCTQHLSVTAASARFQCIKNGMSMLHLCTCWIVAHSETCESTDERPQEYNG